MKSNDNNNMGIEFETALKENFFEIIESISDEVLISDGNGVVLWVNPGFEDFYDVSIKAALGITVFEMEKRGIFRPSIIAKVLESKEKVTMEQKTSGGKNILVTATPICDEKGNIKMVVSYSRDITEMIQLQKKYSKMQQRVEKYTAELQKLRTESSTQIDIIGKSAKMEKVITTINRVSGLDANVLLLGESGVGKTMFAKIIHQKSHRAKGPFIDINCAAIPENLLESELFGYEKGSFTGANAQGKVGLMELADGGTLFLDEISELPLGLQAKLLKVIQEKVITRVGGTKPVKVDFRLISASNRKLDKFTSEGKFRKDLYYRLNVVDIEIPPLSERREDIIPLVDYFAESINNRYNMNKRFSPQAIEILTKYTWPGNVRELANVVERAIVTSSNHEIKSWEIPLEIDSVPVSGEVSEMNGRSLEEEIENLERKLLLQAYETCHTTTAVAKALKISQPTASRKLKKYLGED